MNIKPVYYAFSTSYDGLASKIINEVFVSSSEKNIPVSNIDTDVDNVCRCNAIWDTGAENTVVSSRLIARLELPIVSKTRILGVNGSFDTTTHMVDIALPNKIFLRQVRVIKGNFPEEFDVLVGMDIITRGDLSISNYGGKTLFSFRLPSIGVVDYAKQAELTHRVKSAKIGRNVPCPCGSGRKYKNCCGRS